MNTIILVEPENPENTGFLARLCENFDFKLRIVNPKFNLDESRKTANNAQDKLRNIQIYDSVKVAIEDLNFVVGTKPGKGISSKKFTFRDNIAIMLGRESSGLSKRELELCDTVVHISSDYSSLNLSHAASILMYEAYTMDEDKEFADSARLSHIRDNYGDSLANIIGRASPTEDEIDRLIGELNR